MYHRHVHTWYAPHGSPVRQLFIDELQFNHDGTTWAMYGEGNNSQTDEWPFKHVLVLIINQCFLTGL